MDNCFQVRRLALFSACASPESDGRTRLEPVLSENSLRPMADAISATNRRIIQRCLSPNTTICVTRRERVERVSLSRQMMQIDLHGYHPAEIVFNGTLAKILQQAWEMGEDKLILIHGHGRNRGISPGFVNTNTGYFGLCIRQALRHDRSLRQWIKYTTLDCWNMGSTSIKLKANPAPTRKKFDCL